MTELPNTESKENIDATLSIVYAEKEDIEKIIEWDEQARLASIGEGYDEQGLVRKRKFFEETLGKEDKNLVLIQNSLDENIGFALISTTPEDLSGWDLIEKPEVPLPEDIGENTAFLRSIAIDPVHRGQGHGTQVLKQLEKAYKNRGRSYFVLEMGEKNVGMQKTAKDYNFALVRGSEGYEDKMLLAWKKI